MKPQTLLALNSSGYDFAEKVEGVSFISREVLAVINDNDFGLSGAFDQQRGLVPLKTDQKTVLALIFLAPPQKSSLGGLLPGP